MDVRTYVRTDGRSHDHVITKISRLDGLPHFLTNGAPRARSSAIAVAKNWDMSLNFTLGSSFPSTTDLPGEQPLLADGLLSANKTRTLIGRLLGYTCKTCRNVT